MSDNEVNIPIERQDADMGITSEVLKLPIDEARKEVIYSLLGDKEPYTSRLWAGRLTVYFCNLCNAQDRQEDNMIMHVLGHFPEDSRETLLEILIEHKEKNNE